MMTFYRRIMWPVLVGLLWLAACSSDSEPEGSNTPAKCSQVTGTAYVSLSEDGGDTVLPFSETATLTDPYDYYLTFGLVTTDIPDRLVAMDRSRVVVSHNGGCNWSTLVRLPDSNTHYLRPSSNGLVYAWTPYSQRFYAIQKSGNFDELTAPSGFRVLAVDPNNSERLRLMAHDETDPNKGRVVSSEDGGHTWSTGPLAPTRFGADHTSFNPHDPDHLVVTSNRTGHEVGPSEVWSSMDGGQNWNRASGLEEVSVRQLWVAISPADPNIVWLYGNDGTMVLARSSDGGLSFEILFQMVVRQEEGWRFYHMFPSPIEADKFYAFDRNYLIKYDHTSREFSHTQLDLDGPNRDADVRISTLAFHPQDPEIIYLGKSYGTPEL